jgi:two-component sensor histidine kinase
MTVQDTILVKLAYKLRAPPWLLSIVLGLALTSLAVALRYFLPLPPTALMTGFIFPAMMASVILGGTLAGITSFVSGLFLSWYFIIEPRHSLELPSPSLYAMLGYILIGVTVLMGSEVYRRVERKLNRTKVQFAQREVEHQQLLSMEMRHRVKNMLSLVQAVAYQTFAKNDATAVHEFNGRLKAISDAQAILHNERRTTPVADLTDIIANAVKPFGGNITLLGETCSINDQQATWLALTLHELGTNATKHGALSLPYGRVQIDTEMVEDEARIVWQEHGGPKVTKPAATGFGTKLLSQARAKVEYLPGGVRCELRNIHCVVDT